MRFSTHDNAFRAATALKFNVFLEHFEAVSL
jgi:hypothetical protein